MNILFLAYSLDASLGGIERVTDNNSKLFALKGNNIFGMYVRDLTEHVGSQYTDTLQISLDMAGVTDATLFIKKYDIELIINQFATDIRFIDTLSRIKIYSNVRIVSCFHTHPTFIKHEVKAMFSSQYHQGLLGRVKQLLKFVFYPVLSIQRIAKFKHIARRSYDISEHTILLSKSFIEPYAQFIGLEECSKIVVIPNSLTFDKYIDKANFKSKKKQLLIVSRLSGEKRIHLAIQAWQLVLQLLPNNTKWRLVIAGDGPCKEHIENMVRRSKNIEILGHVNNPERLYVESPIFLMTSSFEGFGMTLIEAQQQGCIPIVFNSSSSFLDIIKNGINGVLITNGDVQAMAYAIVDIMKNEDIRYRMAQNAINDSKRFNSEIIYSKWCAIF